MDEAPQTETEKKGVKAKDASLWGQIAAAVWVGGWSAAQFIKDLTAGRPLDIKTVIISGLAIAACFTPVYFNMLMDKIHDIKIGG
jgi:hypothetical protein